MENWHKVIDGAADICTVFSYNRLGIGRSNRPTTPQSAKEVVSTLRALLNEVQLPPPYLLVAHSYGGIFANFYARKFPGEVHGVILVDASHPEQERRFRDLKKYSVSALLRSVIEKYFYKFGVARFSEVALADVTSRQISEAGKFPDIPLTVMTGLKRQPSKEFEAHLRNQTELLQLSSQGTQVLAIESAHFIQITEPDLVLSVLRQMLHRLPN